MSTNNMASSGEETTLSVLLEEFESWSLENSDSSLYLLESVEKDDGSVDLLLSLAGEYEVILHCPSGYPNNEEKFLIETSYPTLQLWSSMMNEFLLDTPIEPKLNDILSKAIILYMTKSASKFIEDISSEEEAMEEDFEDILSEDDSAFTTEWELQIEKLKKRWSQKEVEVRKEIEKARENAGSPDFIAFDILTTEEQQGKQIFSNHASSGILTNDLVEIIQNEKRTGISAEAIDDNIYQWRVRLQNFDPESALHKDLQTIQQKYNYNYIQLMLRFTMDLYPFYPPLLNVVRPRLKGVMMHHVTNLEVLKLSNWNPARSMLNVLLEIKDVLQDWARLEVHSSRNDVVKYPDGAYINLEHSLLRLAMISDLPQGNLQCEIQENKTTKQKNSMKKDPLAKQKQMNEHWAAGTGFGHRDRPQWDIQAYLAAQKLKDKQVEKVLKMIQNEIKELSSSTNKEKLLQNKSSFCCNGVSEHNNQASFNQSCEDNFSNSISMINLQSNGSENNMECCLQESSNNLEDPEDNLYSIVEGSALIPFLEAHFHTNSFLEINRHKTLYGALIDVIKEMYHHPQLIKIFGPLPYLKTSIYDLLKTVNDEATHILRQINKASANGSVPQMKADDRVSNTKHESTLIQEEKLARDFVSMFSELSETMEKYSKKKKKSTDSDNNSAVSLQLDKNSEDLNYQKHLKDGQFQNFSFSVSGDNAHAYSSQFLKSHAPSQSLTFHILGELTSLAKSLPLNISSSIFVRADEEKITLLKVLITGPEGTPYSGGCYLFDIYFPETYPSKPPLVQFKTTGKGTVRFNPNLYVNGKVCLSLLGTWEGQRGEKWNETSTLLQVLVSIQSLILVTEPYFNEPGYEVSIGTHRGKEESRQYNEVIKYNNLYWAILDQLQHPPKEFADVIKRHFYYRKNQLLKEMNGWAQSCKSGKLDGLINSIKKELNNIEL